MPTWCGSRNDRAAAAMRVINRELNRRLIVSITAMGRNQSSNFICGVSGAPANHGVTSAGTFPLARRLKNAVKVAMNPSSVSVAVMDAIYCRCVAVSPLPPPATPFGNDFTAFISSEGSNGANRGIAAASVLGCVASVAGVCWSVWLEGCPPRQVVVMHCSLVHRLNCATVRSVAGQAQRAAGVAQILRGGVTARSWPGGYQRRGLRRFIAEGHEIPIAPAGKLLTKPPGEGHSVRLTRCAAQWL